MPALRGADGALVRPGASAGQMRGTFWHPAAQGNAAEWWARCDNCLWSGPMSRFTVWELKRQQIYLCDHDWCLRRQQLLSALRAVGWVRVV